MSKLVLSWRPPISSWLGWTRKFTLSTLHKYASYNYMAECLKKIYRKIKDNDSRWKDFFYYKWIYLKSLEERKNHKLGIMWKLFAFFFRNFFFTICQVVCVSSVGKKILRSKPQNKTETKKKNHLWCYVCSWFSWTK